MRPNPEVRLSSPDRRSAAVLLIAHGSRRWEANADLEFFAEELRRRGWPLVQPAYLELAEPDIAEAGRRCVARGAKRVFLLPFFLSPGLHVHEDLAEHRDRLREAWPHVDWRLCEPLGRHPLLVDVLLSRLEEQEVR